MKCIILLASPGAGKGVASDYIENKYGYKHISSGSLLRSEALVNDEIKSLIDKGSFVSDETVMDILKKNIDNENIIVDGMPRNLNQAKLFDSLLKEKNIDLEKVIFIDIDEEISKNLQQNGGYIPGIRPGVETKKYITKVLISNLITREDDTEEVFKKRYNTYLNETKPLVDYYKDKLVRIYNNDTLESLYNNLDKEMR